MNTVTMISMTWHDWLGLFLHMTMLSLLSVGGGISIMPAMHQYIVGQQHWLTDTQFNASIVIAQAAPGPNVLMVAIFGWSIGIQTGSVLTGLWGVLVIMLGMMLPCTTLTYYASRWLEKNHQMRAVRAFRLGMVPIVTALLVAAAWVIASAHDNLSRDWALWLVVIVTTVIVWRTRVHLLWLLAAGATLGWFGII
ncbi:MAG: chromate transporter [Oxalobacter sp.]|jgi:chromate transporter|nr:MAG: chromate transporter [Oxalobacter sp.]